MCGASAARSGQTAGSGRSAGSDPVRTVTIVIGLTLVAGCGVGVCSPSFEPIPAEQSGNVVGVTDDGLPVECRGLAADRCRSGAGGDVIPPDIDRDSVDRMVVSCVGRCTARGGEMRMDLVLDDGETRLVGNGGYGEFEQSC